MPPVLNHPTSPSAPPVSLRRLWLLAIMVAVPLSVQLATPMFGDMRSTYAYAFLVDHFGLFPENLFKPFLMRGIGFKCLHYGLYRTASLVVDNHSPFAFELVTRLMYYSGYLLLCVYFFRLLRQRIAAFGIHWLEAMLVFLVGVLATSHHVHQQAEELAVLFAVGLTAFSLSDNRKLNCLSGLFLPLMLSCKVVTIWPAIFPFLMVLATRERGRILRVGASWIGFTVATALFYIFVIPQEIAIARDAAMNQSGSGFDLRGVMYFLRSGAWSMANIPFYLVTVVCLLWLLWRGAERKQWKEWLLSLGAISIVVPPVFIQSLHLRYHYLLFFPAAFLIALWAIRTISDAGQRSRLWLAMAGATFFGWIFFSIVPVEEGAYLWLWAKAAWHQNATLQEMDRRFHLSEEQEMLFLAPGDANYVIRAKSSSRYYGPTLLQRAHNSKRLQDSLQFREMVAEALAYHGNYIYYSDWLPLDHLPELEAKLKTEYEPATAKIPQFDPIPDVQLFKRRSQPNGTDK
ncbi:MAG: hypothetical protein WCJ35_12215 [Planctomycetota bacterium]